MIKIKDGRTELYQWDTGSVLTVGDEINEVHFARSPMGRSIAVSVANGEAKVEDVLLQTSGKLFVWGFVGTAEDGYTKLEREFTVRARNKPADYVFTPPEQITMAEILEQLKRVQGVVTPEAVGALVEEYLRENPVDGAVQIDATLTKEGYAADAKAVGDALQEINKLDAQVTAESIKNALGYTPADAKDIAELSEEIDDVKNPEFASESYSGAIVNFETEAGRIITVSGDAEDNAVIVHQGKNFVPSYPAAVSGESILFTENIDGTITATPRDTSVKYGWCRLIDHEYTGEPARTFQPGKYTISSTITSEGAGVQVHKYNSSGTRVTLVSGIKAGSAKTIELTEPTVLMVVVLFTSANLISPETFSVQLEMGEEATAFERYHSETYGGQFPVRLYSYDGANIVYDQTGANIDLTVTTVATDATFSEVGKPADAFEVGKRFGLYDTVIDMLADKNLTIGQFVETRGYHSAGDGGAAKYTVDRTDQGYGLRGINGYCNIVAEKRMSPKMFGAVANGDWARTDDTEAFQACLDFCAGRSIVDITDGCYVVAGVKLYHGKTYDIVGGNIRGSSGTNKSPSGIAVRYGSEPAFIGSNELGVGAYGLPTVTLNLCNIHASGHFVNSDVGFSPFIKDVHLSQSHIKGITVRDTGCFFEGIMNNFCFVSDCIFFVSDCAFRSYLEKNGLWVSGVVDCSFNSNRFQGILKHGDGTLFKPTVFDMTGFYPVNFSENFVGAMWGIIGCRKLPNQPHAEVLGWKSANNIYSLVVEFITIKDDATHSYNGDADINGDQLWNCSHESLVNSAEGRIHFSDINGNTRIEGERSIFFNARGYDGLHIRGLLMRFSDPVFPEEFILKHTTIDNLVYVIPPEGHDFAEASRVFDTKFKLEGYVAGRDDYKDTRIESWNNRVVETLPVIQDENYRYVLEGQTCYYNNKLLTCRGESWYDAMGNVVTE